MVSLEGLGVENVPLVFLGGERGICLLPPPPNPLWNFGGYQEARGKSGEPPDFPLPSHTQVAGQGRGPGSANTGSTHRG